MENTELEKIKKNLAKSRTAIKKNYSVKTIGLFGSVARGDQKKTSDLDVLVDFSRPIGFFDFIKLENFLTKILKRKVDLISKKALKPTIKKRVFKETIYL